MILSVFGYVATYFIIWEVYILINPTVVKNFIGKESKIGYNALEKFNLSFYIIYCGLGLFLIDLKLYGLLLAIGFTVDLLLDLKSMSDKNKKIMLYIDSVISIFILFQIVDLTL